MCSAKRRKMKFGLARLNFIITMGYFIVRSKASWAGLICRTCLHLKRQILPHNGQLNVPADQWVVADKKVRIKSHSVSAVCVNFISPLGSNVAMYPGTNYNLPQTFHTRKYKL